MSIFFNPVGPLDLNTEPSDMPEYGEGYDIQSDAMQRSKNIRIDELTISATRDGSTNVNSAGAMTGTPEFFIETGGYYLIGTSTPKIYKLTTGGTLTDLTLP